MYIALSSHPKHTEWPQDAIHILNKTLIEKGEYAVYTAAMHKLDERLNVLRNGGVDVQGEIKLLRALRKRVHVVRVSIMTFSFPNCRCCHQSGYTMFIIVLVCSAAYSHVWYAHIIYTLPMRILSAHVNTFTSKSYSILNYIHTCIYYISCIHLHYTILIYCTHIPYTIHTIYRSAYRPCTSKHTAYIYTMINMSKCIIIIN